MALTLEIEQKLTKVGLVKVFEQHETLWQTAAQRAYAYVQENFPKGSKVRPDDVAKALVPVLEVHEKVTTHLSANKLTQKYWVRHFIDLIVDRVFDRLS